MEKQIIKGIIIKSIDYSESSKICHLLTDSGVQSVLVKGAKRLKSKFLGILEPVTLVSFIVSGSNLKVLTDADLVNEYKVIHESIKKLVYANNLLELINVLIHEDYCLIYNFLLKCLNKMEECFDEEVISFIFELKLLKLLGVEPQFDACISCGKEFVDGFNIELGGVVCKACSGIHNLELLNTIYELYRFDISNDIPNIDEGMKSQLRAFIDEYYKIHVGYITKAHRFFNS